MKKRMLAALLCLMLLLCACEKQEAEPAAPGLTPKSVEEYRQKMEQLRNAIPQENVLMEDGGDLVLGSEYRREEILAVRFQAELKKAPAGSWDVSRDCNRKVVAWVEQEQDGPVLVIAAQGGIRAPENCRDLFAGYRAVKSIDFGGCFDTSAVTDMSGMFRDCAALEGVLDLSGFQTSAVTDMSGMFAGLKQVDTVDLSAFDTANVTDMEEMFRDYGGSLDLGTFHTEKVRDMSRMFAGSTVEVLDLKSFSTGNVTTMQSMFDGCTRLRKLDITSLNTGKVTDMQAMFRSCGLAAIDVSRFETGLVRDMSSMFAGCVNVTGLTLGSFDTGAVETMASMFNGCEKLVTVDVSSFDTANVTDMSSMFWNCGMLDTPDLRHFDVSNVEEFSQFMMPGTEVNGAPWEAMFSSSLHLTF